MPQPYSDNNPLDKRFREALTNHPVTPRKRVWGNIANALETDKANKAVAAGRFKFTISLPWLLGASGLTAAVAALIWFAPFSNNKTGTQQAAIAKPVNVTANANITATTSVQLQQQVNSQNKANVITESTNASANKISEEGSSSINKRDNINSTTNNNRTAPVSKKTNVTAGANAANGSTTSINNNTNAAANSTQLNSQLTTLNSNLKHTINILNKVLKQAGQPVAGVVKTEALTPLPARTDAFALTLLQTTEQAKEIPLYEADNTLITNGESIPRLIGASPVCIKGFYAGLVGAANSTWLIDSRATNTSTFKYTPTYGQAYGVRVGYIFNNWLGIETGSNIISYEGQKYHYIPPANARVEPQELKNRITLNYTQVPVIVKLKSARTSRLTHKPVVFNVNLGVQYNHLNSVLSTIDDQIATNNNFKTSALAALLGVGYDVYLSQKVFISGAIQGTYTNNLYTNKIPITQYNQFIAPHSIVGGVQFGVHYVIPGCN